MSLLILHLSDIHIRAASDPILKRADLIARTLNEHLATASLVVIIVSGDIAFSGTKKEYLLAKSFLEDLRKRIRKEARCDVEFVICPGNHDCDFTTNNSSRENNISAMQGGGSVDQSVINSCTRIQDEFFRFRDTLETWKNTSGDKLWRTHAITIEGKRIVFDSLNVSWVSKKREDKNLFFPVENYRSTAEGTKSDVRFITFHHPLNWFAAANYRPFRRLLRTSGSVLLSGHEHEGNIGALDESESGQSIYVEALVLQDGTNLESTGFSILHVDLAEMELTHHRLNYNKDEYSEDASGARRIKIPSANSEMLAVQPDFRRMLDDAGAISRPESPAPLTLQDIYVFPDLRKLHQRTRSRKFLDSKILLQPVNTEGGVILECEERLGSTSLLYQIYSAYLNQGFAPILLRGSDIKRKDTGHLDSLIDSAIKQQYLEKDRNFVAQRTRAEKILLIDDLDDSKVKDASSRSHILCHYNKRFDHLVVTTPKNFELEEIIESTTSDDLANLTHYEIQPLGYTKRSELVRRWVSIGSQGLDSSQYISECDKAERLISAAMHKSLIPSAPLYLLTLLQSISSGRSADLKESSLGHYYEFLLTDALLSAGVNKSKLNELHQYATQLAWEFSSHSVSRLSKSELQSFNAKFSREYVHRDFEETLSTLLSARILLEGGDEYEFRYPYMFYHLKGKYLSNNLEDPDVQKYVQRCCDHLYVRDYANTILFLAHHTTYNWFLDTIKSSMDKVFADSDEVHFNGDSAKINALVSDAPELVYRGGTPEEHRDARNKELDEHEQEAGDDDGLMDSEEKTEKRSLSSEIVTLFKTSEILGQILKNQYSAIRRPTKVVLIKALFDGSLRGLGRFFKDLHSDSEKIVAKIRRLIEESGKENDPTQRDKLARRFVAEIVQSVSTGILSHTALSVNSDDLADDIAQTVEASDSCAYELLQLATQLDSAKPIPRKKLEALYEERRQDVVVWRIVQMLVLNRLYMFKTSESDMSWIASKLKIPIDQQHLITYSNQGKRIR